MGGPSLVDAARLQEVVLSVLDDDRVAIVNALERIVFQGDRLDYGRAGPRVAQRALPRTVLRRAFSRVLDSHPERIVTYCGAGVAAASAAFVLGLLGEGRVAVYDGSMLEWAADPSLPLVTGD